MRSATIPTSNVTIRIFGLMNLPFSISRVRPTFRALFYDYRKNVEAYQKWQAWMREKQPRLLVIWRKHDLSFDLSEPEAYRRDVPNAEVHVLDAGHFALDTAAEEIAQLVRRFME
jgi:pimeloyl-ACP methyl ester carboxylesterase